MIHHLKGTLTSIRPTDAIIECGGVGYQALITSKTFENLQNLENEEVKILTHEIQKEDGRSLYGFADQEERTLFLLLTKLVTGIGPKSALAILSGMNQEEFKNAVASSDTKTISRIKGVGPKMAERICIELKGKVGVVETWQAKAQAPPEDGAFHDTILALISLGYQKAPAKKAVEDAKAFLQSQGTTKPEAETLLRAALKSLA